MSFVPTKLYILFQWQSKVVDLVDPIPSLISIYFLCIMKLVLVLNIDEILLVGCKTIINQSINPRDWKSELYGKDIDVFHSRKLIIHLC
jgi:uncharacterized protein YhhL (DUF1145 family)